MYVLLLYLKVVKILALTRSTLLPYVFVANCKFFLKSIKGCYVSLLIRFGVYFYDCKSVCEVYPCYLYLHFLGMK